MDNKPKRRQPRARKVVFDDVQIGQIETMRGMGMTIAQVANILGISIRALQENALKTPNLRVALDRGKDKAVLAVAGALYRKAVEGNIEAAKFWLKTQGGWSEKIMLDVNTKHTVVYETQIADGKIRNNVKQIGADSDVIDAIVDDLTKDVDVCTANESE